MTIKRTRHVSISIGLIERMPDNDLKECFPKNTPVEIREYLNELRAEGLEYLPCQCETQNSDGSCKGWEKTTDVHREQGIVNEIRA